MIEKTRPPAIIWLELKAAYAYQRHYQGKTAPDMETAVLRQRNEDTIARLEAELETVERAAWDGIR